MQEVGTDWVPVQLQENATWHARAIHQAVWRDKGTLIKPHQGQVEGCRCLPSSSVQRWPSLDVPTKINKRNVEKVVTASYD